MSVGALRSMRVGPFTGSGAGPAVSLIYDQSGRLNGPIGAARQNNFTKGVAESGAGA